MTSAEKKCLLTWLQQIPSSKSFKQNDLLIKVMSVSNNQFPPLIITFFAGRRGVPRDRFSSDRYGYGGRGGVGVRHGSGGHAPSNEESGSSVTRKKTPLQHLHQKAGVSACTMCVFIQSTCTYVVQCIMSIVIYNIITCLIGLYILSC